MQGHESSERVGLVESNDVIVSYKLEVIETRSLRQEHLLEPTFSSDVAWQETRSSCPFFWMCVRLPCKTSARMFTSSPLSPKVNSRTATPREYQTRQLTHPPEILCCRTQVDGQATPSYTLRRHQTAMEAGEGPRFARLGRCISDPQKVGQ